MNVYHSLVLLALFIVVAILIFRYVGFTVDREFRNLARAVDDGEFREDELKRVDGLLVDELPLPADARPLFGPLSTGRGLAPPLLIAVGIILLWGTMTAREEKALWLGGGFACLALASAIMLVTLRRRKWERVARLLRFRADLKRMDGDREGAAADLRELLKLTPWDDAAWAELSDDLAAGCRLEEALDAMGQAARLDPVYDEYRMLEASLALRLGFLEKARAAIELWVGLDRVRADDPRPVVYRAALDLAEGNREKARASLENILLGGSDGPSREFLDMDQALAEVRELLPGVHGEDRCEVE